MQVDGFTEVVINGTSFTKVSKAINKETNTDTYEFTDKAKDLLITVRVPAMIISRRVIS